MSSCITHVLPVGGRGKLGVDGFRAWVAAPDDDVENHARYARGDSPYEIEQRACGWAPDLDRHYRVKFQRHAGA